MGDGVHVESIALADELQIRDLLTQTNKHIQLTQTTKTINE